MNHALGRYHQKERAGPHTRSHCPGCETAQAPHLGVAAGLADGNAPHFFIQRYPAGLEAAVIEGHLQKGFPLTGKVGLYPPGQVAQQGAGTLWQTLPPHQQFHR